MKPLKKFAALAVLLIGIFSFNKKESNLLEPALNLETINIEKVLTKQQFECRPSSDFIFYVETNLVKKIRGANNINAKVFIMNRATGRKNLLAEDNIQIKKFKDAVFLEEHENNNMKKVFLENGDKIIGNFDKTPYAFNELVKYEAIYNSYINATNKLLNLKRSI